MDEDVANLLHEARELLGEDGMPNTPRAAAKDSGMVTRGSTAHPLDRSTEDQDWALVADAMDSALRWRQLGSGGSGRRCSSTRERQTVTRGQRQRAARAQACGRAQQRE